jgi:hypothetical protein
MERTNSNSNAGPDGITIHLKLSNGDGKQICWKHPPEPPGDEGTTSTFRLLKDLIHQATEIPASRQRLLVDGRVVRPSNLKETLEMLSVGSGSDKSLTVLPKYVSYTTCSLHSELEEDCFCYTCRKFMCAKCVIKHTAVNVASTPSTVPTESWRSIYSAAVGTQSSQHRCVDMSDDAGFFEAFRTEREATQGALDAACRLTEREAKRAEMELEEAAATFFAKYAAMLETSLRHSERVRLRNQFEELSTPVEVGQFWIEHQNISGANSPSSSFSFQGESRYDSIAALLGIRPGGFGIPGSPVAAGFGGFGSAPGAAGGGTGRFSHHAVSVASTQKVGEVLHFHIHSITACAHLLGQPDQIYTPEMLHWDEWLAAKGQGTNPLATFFQVQPRNYYTARGAERAVAPFATPAGGFGTVPAAPGFGAPAKGFGKAPPAAPGFG